MRDGALMEQIAALKKERDAVLSEIVSYQESLFATGTADKAAVTSAHLALRTFRRDTAATVAEKIKQQESIVQAYEKNLATVKTRMNTGLGTRFDFLTATDVLLQAKQLLEELKLNEKKS